jgi:Protein of unknown function (DUF2851).
MITRNRIKIPEKTVTLMWQQLLGKELVTEEGKRVRGIYPGRINGDSGPDFRDAVVAMGGFGLVKGDIEVHVRSSSWYSHGHCADPKYNNPKLCMKPQRSGVELPSIV